MLGFLPAVLPPYLVAGRLRQAMSRFALERAAAYSSSESPAAAHLVKLRRDLHFELAACWTTPCDCQSQRACSHAVKWWSARCSSFARCGLALYHRTRRVSLRTGRSGRGLCWARLKARDDVGRVNLRADPPTHVASSRRRPRPCPARARRNTTPILPPVFITACNPRYDSRSHAAASPPGYRKPAHRSSGLVSASSRDPGCTFPDVHVSEPVWPGTGR